jgi:hypothetical protein
MNSHSSSRKNYGILLLTPAIVEGIQLEFALIEAPAPRARFLNFPCTDVALTAEELRRMRRQRRDIAA